MIITIVSDFDENFTNKKQYFSLDKLFIDNNEVSNISDVSIEQYDNMYNISIVQTVDNKNIETSYLMNPKDVIFKKDKNVNTRPKSNKL